MRILCKVLFALIAGTISLLAAGKVVPDKIDLPADFKATADQAKANRPFGFPGGWACEIGVVNGLKPLYLTAFEKGMLRGEPLAVADVILAVDGEALVNDPVGSLGKKLEAAKKANSKLRLTRWRAGAISEVQMSPNPEAPDFTLGDNHPNWHDWTLGPTGLRGWMHGRNVLTSETRQILVTAVAAGSPADGLIKVNDVILGIDGKKFTDDARIQLARAIARAEEKKGILRLTRWQAGKVDTVELKLKVMGAYSDTAPFDCPKSKRIFELGCEAIAKRGLKTSAIFNDLNALLLLASGKEEYRPMLADYAKVVAKNQFNGYPSWSYGYACMFLGEYILATGDQSVFEGLQRITMEAVKSQSAVGMWGHRPALPDGNLNGYGGMNQPGLSVTMGLLLAREAGVKSPELDQSITKSLNFLHWYAGKGAIPYGDHLPWNSHDDGGKTGAAAIVFDLAGDRAAAEFFAKMSTAGYAERETAHVGNYFCYLWALPAVIRCGPVASGAYMKEQSWYYDLARTWDGSVAYQGPPQGGQEYNKYTNWDCTGSFLLGFAAQLKSLHLTGKKPFSFPALDRKQTAEVIAAGRDFTPGTDSTCYSARTTAQLLAGLSSWSPAVRYRSALSLAKRDGDFTPALLKLLAGTDPNGRYGALTALSALGPKADAAAPQLRAALSDNDPWVQSLACDAIPRLSKPVAATCVEDLLKMAASKNLADPRSISHRYAAMALFEPSPGNREPRPVLDGPVDSVDRALLFPAVRSLLKNEDSVPRGAASSVFSKLPPADIAALLPDLIPAIERKAPSDEMFSDGVRIRGLELLEKLHIREGMDLCVQTENVPGKRMEILKRYGVHAKAYIPQLKEKAAQLATTNKDAAKAFEKVIGEIEALTATPPLISLKDYIDQASAGKLDPVKKADPKTP